MKKYICGSTKMLKKRGERSGITSIFTIQKDFIRLLDIKRPRRFTMETGKNQKITMGRARSPHGGILPSLCGPCKAKTKEARSLIREIMRLTSLKEKIV